MVKQLSLLGSTGSIGTQSLNVCRHLDIRVVALTAHKNAALMEQQIREFHPKVAVMTDRDAYGTLKVSVADTDTKVLFGMEGLCEAAALPQADTVLNSVVGMVGLRPTLAAIEAGKDLALANKETLVTGGSLVMRRAEEKGVKILPVDSEHSAIFQCLQGNDKREQLHKIILTASGGPFFGKTRQELEQVTVEQALCHPNWSMGAKITVDSATLMNKGLEVIEAVWLFGKPAEDIEIVVHRESVIHSAVEYADGSVIAQMGVPDMQIPIQYALTWPDRLPSTVKPLSLTDYGKLTFYKPDLETFTCLRTCLAAIRQGGLRPCAANGANEKAVELFLQGKLRFLQIGEIVEEAAG
ncbi:MAG: 1-deoxy-D-xylulose-5-phosphate reductoisomerase, partial [Oscillospiraceae bacterium]|nr:1-deoxy-D-xylulose-5-phosphate reductoisomerase [Oscillospiraceae bacterium]